MNPSLTHPPSAAHRRGKPRRPAVALSVAVYVGALALLLWLLRQAPFYTPSYLFWIGFVGFLAGAISLMRPLRILFIDRRRIGAFVLGGGLLLSATGLFWPAPVRHSTDSRHGIDSLLPDYTFGEYHEVCVRATPEEALRLSREIDFDDIPTIRFLMQVRQFAGRVLGEKQSPLDDSADRASPFQWDVIKAGPDERLLCLLLNASAATPPPPVTSANQFVAFRDNGYVKVVANFRVEDLGDGITRLSTETRVQPNDASARHFFRFYWRVIYPGTAMTRRAWLDTLAAHAGNPRPPS